MRFVATRRRRNGLDRYGQYGVFDLADGGTVRHHDLNYFMQLMSGFVCLELETHEVETMNENRALAIRYLGRLESFASPRETFVLDDLT